MFDLGNIFDAIMSSDAMHSFKRLLTFFSMIFLIGIIIIFPKYVDAERRRRESLLPERGVDERASFHPERWEAVLNHVHSVHPAEWRVAIMEADNILEGVVKGMGYQGDSLGEILKSMDVGDLRSINEAWEAHRARNAIAHEGSQFVLTEREAKRIVGLYRKVFEDLEYL
ncbi:hypothetical protein L0Y69_01975 [bacterium]|nr:hypothetical protein [bacterium]